MPHYGLICKLDDSTHLQQQKTEDNNLCLSTDVTTLEGERKSILIASTDSMCSCGNIGSPSLIEVRISRDDHWFAPLVLQLFPDPGEG